MNRDRIRLVRQFISSPPDPKLVERKAEFADLNELVQAEGGWLVSVPGDPLIRLEALPGSALPGQLQAMGYIVEKTGTIERILPMAIRQAMTLSSSGALVALVEGSTRPVSMVVTSAGIHLVETFDLRVP